MKKTKLKMVQRVLSIIFIFAGLMTTMTNVLFIFMLVLGVLINPKFNDIYVKLTKKEPLKKSYRIIASVISFLMIYVAMGVYSLSDDEVSTAGTQEVSTETTTVSTTKKETTKTTTTATTTEKVTTTTAATTTEATTTTEEVTTTEAETEETTKKKSTEFTVPHGEVLSVNGNVIKVKAEYGYNNKTTIDMNYYNIEDIIKNQGGDRFSEIQYWAVGDTTGGDTVKIISFTVSKSVIQSIADGNIPANTIGDYVDDLWIHPSLQD